MYRYLGVQGNEKQYISNTNHKFRMNVCPCPIIIWKQKCHYRIKLLKNTLSFMFHLHKLKHRKNKQTTFQYVYFNVFIITVYLNNMFATFKQIPPSLPWLFVHTYCIFGGL